MELANMKAVYENSPVGFAFGELEYDEYGDAVNFHIHYINPPGARVLGSLPENLMDKAYVAMFPETDKRWIMGFERCARTGEKQIIKGFSAPLGKSLSLLCFKIDKQQLGCFIIDITNEATDMIHLFDDQRSMSEDESSFTDVMSHFLVDDDADSLPQEQMLAETAEAVSIFHDCISIMTADAQLEDALQQTIHKMCHYFGAEKGSITLFSGMDIQASWAVRGRCEQLFFSSAPSIEAVTEWTMLLMAKKHVVISDCTDELIPEPIRHRFQKQGIYSVYLLPVFSDHMLSGFIMMCNVTLNQSQSYIMNFVVSTVSRLIHSRILQEKNRQMQFRDPLTGYLNLEGFLRTANKLIRANQDKKYALWYCDLRRFKYINDMFGYDVGDDLLKYWAGICKTRNREGEIFGRVTADNFVLLRWYNNEQEIAEAFQRDEAALANFDTIRSRGYTPELTCGIYLLDAGDVAAPDVNKIMDKANIAQQFSHNKSGTHYMIYDEWMRQKQLREMDIGQHMSEGIREGEFAIWMQPQYDYVDGSIVGAEALVRWKHPQLGNISPAEFIPVLERNGQITELDLYVWEEACRYIRYTLDHQDRLTTIPISINISRIDIYLENLQQVLVNLINKYNLQPKMLRLEITESAYMENPEQLIEVVEKLQNCGFVIEMDDFGSGFSSLNILKDVPVEVLKLDMKFLAGEEDTGGRKGNILSSVIRMARWLGMELIAEGVETMEQAEYLKNMGCSYMQGYYFAKPMPLADFDVVLSNAEVSRKWFSSRTCKRVFNTGQFMESQSEAAYMFNTCIGGAALLEYEEGRLEVVLMNDMFLAVHNIAYHDAYNYWNSMFDFWLPGNRRNLLDGIETAIHEGVSMVEVQPAEATDRWVRCSLRHLSKEDNSHMFFVLAEDITDHKRMEETLDDTVRDLNSLMNLIPGGVLRFSAEEDQDQVNFVSQGLFELLGCSQAEIKQRFNDSFYPMVYREDRERVRQEIRNQSQAGDTVYCEYRIKTAGGGLKWVTHDGRLVQDHHGRRWFYVIITDLDNFKLTRRTLRWQTIKCVARQVHDIDEESKRRGAVAYDATTGLLNQAATDLVVNKALSEGKHGVLYVIDVNGLGDITQASDLSKPYQWLRNLARRLKASFRDGDIVGYLGDGQFVAYLPGICKKALAEKKAKDIYQVIYGQEHGSAKEKNPIMMGAMISRNSDITYAELLGNAEAALTEAMELGKTCSVMV